MCTATAIPQHAFITLCLSKRILQPTDVRNDTVTKLRKEQTPSRDHAKRIPVPFRFEETV